MLTKAITAVPRENVPISFILKMDQSFQQLYMQQVFHKLKGHNDIQPAEDIKQNISLICLQNLYSCITLYSCSINK